jgi:cytochrome c-type biogenesis protein CcmH
MNRHRIEPAVARVVAVLCLAALPALHASTADLSEAQADRYQKLVTELRCLVCQNQSIADSNAPLASDLRMQVREQILAGRSDDQIRSYVTERYSDFVLYRPPLRPSTWLLWFGPFLLLACGLAVAAVYARRRRQRAAPAAVDTERLRRLLDEEKP